MSSGGSRRRSTTNETLALFCVRTPEEAAGRAALVDGFGLKGGADVDLGALAPFARALATLQRRRAD